MRTAYGGPPAAGPRPGLDAVRRDLVVLVVLGVALIVVGFVALGSLWVASLATAVAIGALLVVSGVAEAVTAFWSARWGGMLLHLLSGVLSFVVGALFLRAPVGALLTLTLL